MPRCIVSGGFAIATKSSCSSLFAGAEFVGSFCWVFVHSNPRARVPCSGLHVLIMLRHFLGLGAYVARSRRTAFFVGVYVRFGPPCLGLDQAAVQAA